MRAALALLLCAACAHTQSAASGSPEVLARRPQIEPLQPFAAPIPKLHKLQNGLKVYVVEKPGDGIEAFQLLVRRGTSDDPPQLPGVASLAMDMLETGSAGRSQTEIAAAADAIGATIHAGAGADGSVVSASAMVSRIEPLVALFADVALRPNFAEAEWTRIKSQRTADLIAERAEPRAAASRAFERAVYGDHPYGRPGDGTVESVQAIKIDDAKAFVAGLRPEDAAVVAVGGAPEAQVLELLKKAFEGWQAGAAQKPAERPQAAAAPPAQKRVVIVDFPGKPQTVMRAGEPGVPRSSPDVMALRAWNSIVGGSFTSRLNQNLREKHSFTYGASSRFAFGAGPGAFTAGADVKTADTAAALRELLGELSRAIAEPVSDAELSKAKSLMAFNLVSALEHADGAASAFGQLFLYDLPDDEFATFVARLSKLTSADAQAAARRDVHPDKLTIVLVGDRATIEKQLAEAQLGLPAPELRNVEGQPAGGK